jgi:Bacterial conjugation TrbI-like protein
MNHPQADNTEVTQGEILPDPQHQTQPSIHQHQPSSSESHPPTQTESPVPEPQQPVEKPKPAAFDPQDMANLAGMDFEDPISSAITKTDRQENIDGSKTQLPVYKQSLFKLLVIGGSLLIATLGVGKLIFPSQKEEVAAAPKQTVSPVDKTKAEFAPDPRFGVVNSKLAMEGQEKRILDAASTQQQVAAAQTKANQSPASMPAATPGTAAAATVDSNPQIIKNSNPPIDPANQSPPPISPATAPVKPSPAPVAPVPKAIAATPPAPKAIAMKPVPIASLPKAITAPSRQPAIAKPIQIARASQIQVPVAQQSNAAPIVKTPVTWEVANRNAVGLWGRSVSETPPAVAAPTVRKSPSKVAVARTIPAAVGQQIKSKLVVPYQSPTTAPTQLIFIGLSTPVLDIRGEVLLPTGTQIMCEVAAMDNGMLQVNSAKASIDGQLIDLPKNSIMLQDASKQPLVAQLKSFGQGEVFNRDLYAIAGNVATAVGQNLTQPQTQTIASNGGIVQSTNPSINIPGAALSGFAPVVSQWMQRNQSAVTQINAASKIWFLPTGTEVNLIVAQSFTL